MPSIKQKKSNSTNLTNQKPKPKKRKKIICIICGLKFTPKPMVRDPKCCSETCRDERKKQLNKEYFKLKPKSERKAGRIKGVKVGKQTCSTHKIKAKCPECEEIYDAWLDVEWIGNGMMRKRCPKCIARTAGEKYRTRRSELRI